MVSHYLTIKLIGARPLFGHGPEGSPSFHDTDQSQRRPIPYYNTFGELSGSKRYVNEPLPTLSPRYLAEAVHAQLVRLNPAASVRSEPDQTLQKVFILALIDIYQPRKIEISQLITHKTLTKLRRIPCGVYSRSLHLLNCQRAALSVDFKPRAAVYAAFLMRARTM